MAEKEKRLSLSNGSSTSQSTFEGRAYFLLNLMSLVNVIVVVVTKLGGIYGVVSTSVSFVVITVIVIRAFFMPFPAEDPRHRRALLFFVCLIGYGVAIGGFILSLQQTSDMQRGECALRFHALLVYLISLLAIARQSHRYVMKGPFDHVVAH